MKYLQTGKQQYENLPKILQKYNMDTLSDKLKELHVRWPTHGLKKGKKLNLF